jgi:fibronectin-binding autotransporter adhesin
MKPRINPFLRSALAASILTSANAAQITWLGNTSGDLTDAANWVGGVAPVTATDGILFGAPGIYGTSLQLNSNIQYSNTGGAIVYGATAPTYTISGSGLITLGTGSIVNNSGVLQVINNNLKRNTGNNITIGANGGILEFNGTYDFNRSATVTTLNQMSFGSTVGGVIAFNGGLVNTGTVGIIGLTTAANGMTVLGGTNTVLDGTVVVSGASTLKLISAGAVNAGQNISTANASNGTLWLASDSAVNSFNIANGAALSQRHNYILGTGASGNAVTDQQIGTFAIANQNNYNFRKAGNVVSGTPTATFTGTASYSVGSRAQIISANDVNLIFSAATAVDYSGTTGSALVLDGTTTGSKITGNIVNSNTGNLGLTKAGTGTWTLSGANTYREVTAINNGVLKLDFNAVGAPNGDGSTTGNILYNNVTAAATSLGGGNLWVAGKNGISSTQVLGALNVVGNTGGNAITLRAGTGGGSSAAVTVTGFTLNTAASVNFDLGADTSFRNTAISSAAFVGGTAYYGGNEFARYDATGYVVSAVDANYTSAVAATGTGSTSGYYRLDGSLTRDAALDFAYKGLRLGNTADSDSLNLNGGTLTFSNSGLIYKGGFNNQYEIKNGAIRGNSVATDFNVVSGATLKISSDMNNNTGAAAFTKSGAGTVKIAGAKAFTGRVSVFEGVYEFDSIDNGGSNSGLGASSNAAANLYLYGGTLKYTGAAASTDRSFTVGSRGAIIDASGDSGALIWAPAAALAYANTNNIGGIANASQDQHLTFTGNRTADNTFGSALGLIADAGIGRTFVTKSGVGKWILNQANTYTGGTKINGGTLGITNANALGTIGAISFGGGSLQYGTGITQDLSHRIQHSTGAIGIDTNGNNVTFQSRLDETNVGGLTKTGAGTLTLANSNIYSGVTNVQAGTLLVNGSINSTGAVNVDSGSTLGGTGRIAGAVNVTGVLSPGASIESLGSGTLSFSNGSTFAYEINTSTIGADLQYVTGGLNLDGIVTLSLSDLGAAVELALGTKFTLISYTGAWDGDTFNGYADESEFTFANNQWRINYNDTSGGSNFTLDQSGATGFVTMTVIPEPRAALLGSLGLFMLLRRRRD